MIFCAASAMWSRPVSSPCCTEHGQRRGVVLSGHITIVAMSRSGQLGRHCTIEPNYSIMSAHLTGTSVTCDHALESCEPSCVPGAARPFFIYVVHNPLGAVGYMAAPKHSSRGGRARSRGTCGSTGVHLVREARSGAERHVAAPKLTSARRRGPGPRDTW
jgi:hypothetical protein